MSDVPDSPKPDTLLDLMEPWQRQGLYALDPKDPDVAKVIVSAYAQHLREGGASAFFVRDGTALAPMAMQALEEYAKGIEVSDEDLMPGIDKILEVAVDPAAHVHDHEETRVSDEPRTLSVIASKQWPGNWEISDGLGPLGLFPSEEEATEAMGYLQNTPGVSDDD